MSDLGVAPRHVLRHAVLPGDHALGLGARRPVSGAVVVETIFARPGLGRMLVIGRRSPATCRVVSGS